MSSSDDEFGFDLGYCSSDDEDRYIDYDLDHISPTEDESEALLVMPDDEYYHLGGAIFSRHGNPGWIGGRMFCDEDYKDNDPSTIGQHHKNNEDDVDKVPVTYDEDYYNFHETFSFKEIIHNDDREEFVWALKHKKNSYFNYGSDYSHYHPQTVLRYVCESRAIKCAEALLSRETPVVVHLNLPSWRGMHPLHHLAYFSYRKDTPAMVELLLCYGARTDIRGVGTSAGEGYRKQAVEKCANKLPLEIAIERMSLERYYSSEWSEWTPNHCIYKLITILCLPRMQNHLEIIALLAGMTKETGEVFLEYAKQGKVIELATLLIAAPKEKLKDVMDKLHQDLDVIQRDPSLVKEENLGEKIAAVKRLIEVFDKAGDDISAYVKSNRFYDSDKGTLKDVNQFLTKAGFDVKDSDDKWLTLSERYHSWQASNVIRKCLVDFGMAHYGKSGYRWKSCEVTNNRRSYIQNKKDPWLRYLNHEAYMNELENAVKALKEKNDKIAEKRQQLKLHVWMDDELWDVLEQDDKEAFLSMINRKLNWFSSRQQFLLYAVCSFGSIKCAEALVKGETPLTVDLNLPCTDTGLYPLHCAALSLFPSITELFIYYGAQTDVRFTFNINRPHVYPDGKLEEHTNKLPLHMALHAISHLPCMREWSLKDPVTNLVTLLCLPRMQNALETLSLLAMTTKETKDIFEQLSMDGHVVQVAALHIAAHKKLYTVCHTYVKTIRSLSDLRTPVQIGEDKYERAKAQHLLHEIFDSWGGDISAYVQEDKHNVTKYQVVEEIACMLPKPRADLSIYNWYRDEESTYPSQAPYEKVRLPHNDVGMEHYGKYRFRWKSTRKRYLLWRDKKRQADIDELESELRRLRRKNSKEKEELSLFKEPADKKYISWNEDSEYILRQGIPIASRSFLSRNAVDAKKSNHLHFENFSSTRAMSTMTSVSDNHLKLVNYPSKPPINTYTKSNQRRFISSLDQQDRLGQAQSQHFHYHSHYQISSATRLDGHVSPLLKANALCLMASSASMWFLSSRRAMTSMPSIFNAYKSMMHRL